MHPSSHHQNSSGALSNEDEHVIDAMRQLKMAQAINTCVRALLHSDNDNDAASTTLETIRHIAAMDALAVFEKQTGADERVYFDWRYFTGSGHAGEGEWEPYWPDREVRCKLAGGQPIYLKLSMNHDADGPYRNGNGTKNRLLFPIQVFGEWWGGLCLDYGSADVDKDTPLFEAFATTVDLLGIFFERQIASRENAESDKLAGALEMAGTVCHKLNQPMQVILGYASMVTSGDISEPEQVCEIVKMIEDETRRMGIITKNLMGITKYRTVETREVGSMCDIDSQAAIS